MKSSYFENFDFNKFGKYTGYSLLTIIILFILLSIFLNYQDLSNLNVKNSERRKIEDKYSDKNIEESRSKYLIYRKNKAFKKNRGKFSYKAFNLDTQALKKNIKDYKKKLKSKKNN